MQPDSYEAQSPYIVLPEPRAPSPEPVIRDEFLYPIKTALAVAGGSAAGSAGGVSRNAGSGRHRQHTTTLDIPTHHAGKHGWSPNVTSGP